MSRSYPFAVILCMLFIVGGCAGSQSVSISEVRPIRSIVKHPHNKNDAFSRVERWIAKNYVSADEVIQMKDKESGTIVAQGIREMSPYMVLDTYHFSYTLTVDIRDKKMRLTYELNGWQDFGRNMKKDVENMKTYFRTELKPSIVRFVRRESTF